MFEQGIRKREETLLFLEDVLEKQKKGKKKVKGLQKRYKVLETFAGHREKNLPTDLDMDATSQLDS